MSADELCKILGGAQFHFCNERELQKGIAQWLTEAGVPFTREVMLGPAERIDFLIEQVGIEVKVDGALSEVLRQLWRYAQRPEISALILVTRRTQHCILPDAINGKSLACVYLHSL